MFRRGRDRGQQQLKRRVLSQAVAANVVDLTGARVAPRRRRSWLRPLLLGVGGGGLLIGFLVVRAPRPTDQQAVGDLRAPTRVELPEGAASVDFTAAARMGSPPQRISAGSLPLGVRKVVLDPGHGGVDDGAKATGGLLEKDVALDLAQRVRQRLVANGIEVVLTRDRDVAVALRERAAIANRAEADLFLSIHLNWLDPTVAEQGIETYRLGPTDDPRIEQLVAAENAGSGYSFADVRRLLDEIYLDLRQDSSARLAQAVHRELVTTLRRDAPTLRDRGVKTAPFLVLVETGIPAVLAEVGCLSHSSDAERFADSSYRDRVADALAEGIRRYARTPPSPGGIP